MSKKRKIAVIIMVVLLIILIGAGILSFFSYDTDISETNQDFENISENEIINTDIEVYYSSKEEVLDAINHEYVMDNAIANFVKEEGNCWYFADTLGVQYQYCLDEAKIQIIES